jgi:2-polyprenyl-3-methyl-5-hydroxy-6-metoxy-1,4-benzoquinol methylase
MTSEADRLATIADNSFYAQGANGWTTAYSFRLMKRFLSGSNILELGPAEGVMTRLLAGLDYSLTVCEGSSRFCEALRTAHPHANVVNALFEEFEPREKFDNVIFGHVLEHVEDPAALLNRARSWLTEGGRVMSAVPNSRSIHRQVAVLMGLLDFEEALNDADRHHGHRRVYNPETFRREFIAAGYEIEYFGGYWLKPLSNRQIEETWSPEMLDAFMAVGERYPDIAAEMCIVARCKA